MYLNSLSTEANTKVHTNAQTHSQFNQVLGYERDQTGSAINWLQQYYETKVS